MTAFIFLAPLLIVAQGSSIYQKSGESGGDHGCFVDEICPAVRGVIKYIIAEKKNNIQRIRNKITLAQYNITVSRLI